MLPSKCEKTKQKKKVKEAKHAKRHPGGCGGHTANITDAAPPPFPSLNAPQGSGGLSHFCTLTVCNVDVMCFTLGCTTAS